MVRNIVAVVFTIVFLVELYFCSAGSNHRRRKRLKGWNQTTGKIIGVEKVQDEISRKNYVEVTVESADGHTVYSKHSPMFCIYEKGEEVELIEKDGVHRFIGNDRVARQGRKELLIGTIPMLVLIMISALISYLAYLWS